MTEADHTEGRYDLFWQHVGKAARFHPANRFRYYLVSRMLSRLPNAPTRIIDVGCGDATLLIALRNLFPSAALFGSDVSPKQIESNRRAYPNMEFFVADATSPHFEVIAGSERIDSFDLAIATEVIEHVADDLTFIRNVHRLLVPGGYALVTTQSGPRYRMDREVLGHLRHYERADLEAMLRSSEFRIIRSFNSGFPVLTLQKIAVDLLFDRAVGAAASGDEPSATMKAIMTLMYWSMIVSPISAGPQIVILAQTGSQGLTK